MWDLWWIKWRWYCPNILVSFIYWHRHPDAILILAQAIRCVILVIKRGKLFTFHIENERNVTQWRSN
jgi:hypothetical protein